MKNVFLNIVKKNLPTARKNRPKSQIVLILYKKIKKKKKKKKKRQILQASKPLTGTVLFSS